jgi:hypothetical protein
VTSFTALDGERGAAVGCAAQRSSPMRDTYSSFAFIVCLVITGLLIWFLFFGGLNWLLYL